MSEPCPLEVFVPEPTWQEVAVNRGTDFSPRFVSGDPRSERLRVRYFARESDHRLFAKVWFGPGTQGPPGHAHGGSISALLDEAMGFAAWVAGHMALAAQLTINFRRMVPVGVLATCEAWVDEVDGRKITTRAKLFGPDGDNYGDGSALFMAVRPEKLGLAGISADQAFARDMESPPK